MKRKILMLSILFSISISLLCGCKNNDDKYSGYLRTFVEGQPETIDSAMFGDNASDQIISVTQGSLFRRKADGRILPDLTESYDVSDDGKTYTFHLRDTKWSNGEPLTANDFVFAMRRYLDEGGAMPSIFIDMAHIKNAREIFLGDADGNKLPKEELGVRAIDDKTLEICLEKPVGFLPSLLTLRSFSPVNEKFFNSLEKGMYATGPDTILCSGAFVIEDYIPGTQSILVKKNPYYWDADNVRLPGIQFINIDNPETHMAAFKAKAFDAINIGSGNHNDCKNDPDLSKYLTDYNVGSFTYIVFNMDEKAGNDLCRNRNFRLAVSNGINRDFICNNLLNSAASPCYSPLPQGTFFNEKTGEDFINNQDKYKEYCSYNEEKAKEYYEKAREELGLKNVELNILVYSGGSKIVQVVKEQLEKLFDDFTINIEVVQYGEFAVRREEKDYDALIQTYLPDYMDPMSLMLLYLDDSDLNVAGYHSEDFMKIYKACDEGEFATDYDKRWLAMQDAMDVVIKDQPLSPLYIGYRSVLSYENLKDVDYLVGGCVMYQDAYLEEE